MKWSLEKEGDLLKVTEQGSGRPRMGAKLADVAALDWPDAEQGCRGVPVVRGS